MTRERTLMILVGVMAVILVGYWGTKQYRSTLTGLDKKLVAKRAEKEKVTFEKHDKITKGDRWVAYQKQTLSMDPSQVQTRLRDDISKLGVACGMPDTSVNIASLLTNLGRGGRDQKESVRIMSASLHAQGTLDQVMNFMYRLHARPYIVRVKSMSLSRPIRVEQGDIKLNLEAQLEVPILPPIKAIRGYSPAKPDGEEKPRGMYAAYEDYRKTVVRRKLFQASQDIIVKAANPNPANGQPLPVFEATQVDFRWSPEPMRDQSYVTGYKLFFGEARDKLELVSELSKSQTTGRKDGLNVGKTYFWRVETDYETWEGEAAKNEGEVWSFTVAKKPDPPRQAQTQPTNLVEGPKEPQPEPKPQDAAYLLASILSSPLGGQYVVLEERAPGQPNPNAAEHKIEIGGPLYGGTLVYIEPRGAVSLKAGKFRFHPLGEQLESGVKSLDSVDNPYGDIYIQVKQLQEKATGITQAPGSSPDAGG